MAFLGGIVGKIGNALGFGGGKGGGQASGHFGGPNDRGAPGSGFGGGKGQPSFGKPGAGFPGSSNPHAKPGGFPFPAPPQNPSPPKDTPPSAAPQQPSVPKPSPQPKPAPAPAPQPQPQPSSQPLPLPNPNPQPSSSPSQPQPPPQDGGGGGGGSNNGGNGGNNGSSPSQSTPPDDTPPAASPNPPQNIAPSPTTSISEPETSALQEDNGTAVTPIATVGNPAGPSASPIDISNAPGASPGGGSPGASTLEPSPSAGTTPSSSAATGGGLSPVVSAIIAVLTSFFFVLLFICLFRRWMVHRRKLRRQRVATYMWPAIEPPRDTTTHSGWDFSSTGTESMRSSAGFTEPPMMALPSAVLATAVANMPGNTPRTQIFDLGRLQIPPSPPHDASTHTGSSSGRLAPAQSLDIEAEGESTHRTPVHAAFQSAWTAFPNGSQPMAQHHTGSSISSDGSFSSYGTDARHIDFPSPPAPSYIPFTAARALTIETRSVTVPSPMSSPLFQVEDPFAHPMDAMSQSGHGHDAASIVSGHAV